MLDNTAVAISENSNPSPFFFLSPSPANDLWIVKPPAGNNGHGVYVITGNGCLNGSINKEMECCVQEYIRSPLLIRGAKVRKKWGIIVTCIIKWPLFFAV